MTLNFRLLGPQILEMELKREKKVKKEGGAKVFDYERELNPRPS